MRVLVSLPFLLFSVFSFSQIPIGIKAGITINEIKYSTALPQRYPPDFSPIVSMNMGIFSKINLVRKISLIPELQFIQKNTFYEFSFSRPRKVKLDYIELPLLISYEPINWIGIDVGGSLAINIQDNTENNDFNALDAGVLAGMRFNLTDKLSILSRGYYGLTSLSARSKSPGAEYKHVNQNLQFSVAYYLE